MQKHSLCSLPMKKYNNQGTVRKFKGPHPRQRFQSQPRCAARSRLRLLLMVCPHTQRPICSIFLSWIAVLNNVRPRLWWPGEYSIVFRGTTDKIWSLLPIHHSNLNRDFKLRPPNIRKFWSTATATAICKSWWWLRLTEPIHGEIWSRLPLEIAVVVEDRGCGWRSLSWMGPLRNQTFLYFYLHNVCQLA